MKRQYLLIIIFIILSGELAQAQFLRNRRNPTKTTTTDNVDYSRPPKEVIIGDIQVKGLETLDMNAIISLSGLKIGDNIKIPGDEITNVIKKLMRNGIIEDISISYKPMEGDEVTIIIKVVERPRLTRYSFEGVTSTQKTELSEEVELIRGRVLTDALLKNSEMSVRRYFVEKGYLNTEVNIETKDDSLITNGVQMVINVVKKNKVKINKINIYGNESFEASRIKKKMKKSNEFVRFHLVRDMVNTVTETSPSDLVDFFTEREDLTMKEVKEYLSSAVKLNIFSTSKFIEEEYQEDKNLLIAFYNSKGYRDAEIISDSVYFVDKNMINIDITVDEGSRYYFGDISWTGNYVYPDTLLNKVFAIQKGDVYDLELVQKKLQFDPTGTDISAIYMDNGYLFFNVVPVETRIENDTIDLEMRIYEGEQATIKDIIISGNDRTYDHVIRREIRTLPGQYFNRSALIRTQRELSQLGYFDPEAIGINPIPNPVDGTVDIEYSLVERPSDQIELSGGWGGLTGFVGTVGIVFNNFSIKNIPKLENWRPLPIGDGQKLSVRVQSNGPSFQNYSLSFTEPWLGGKKPNSLTVSLNRSVQKPNDRLNRFYERAGFNSFNRGTFILNGATVSYGRRLEKPDDFFTLTHSVSYMQYFLDQFSFARGISDGSYNNLTFNTTLARNSIDNPMFPRTGSSLSLSLSVTPPYSMFRNNVADLPDDEKFRNLEFHKWMFDAKHYIKVAGDLVLEAKAHMGFIGAYNQDLGVGPFERFVMGGSGLAGTQGQFILGSDIISMRGYDDNSLTPTDPLTQDFGGTVYNKIGLELRYPLSLKPAATIYVLGFADAGNNWLSFKDYDPFNMFRTAGIGARIFMPAFGLLGIDWGVAFDNQIGNLTPRQQTFQFTMGQQFR